MRELDLRKALKRYSILQDETDHRIKNSLSSVSSAVRLYERQVEQGGDVAASFRAIRRHLDSTAAVHEAIYKSAADDVDLEVYMSALIPNIRRSMPGRVSITTTVEPVSVVRNMASTVGLIVNEFAANTLKRTYVANAPSVPASRPSHVRKM